MLNALRTKNKKNNKKARNQAGREGEIERETKSSIFISNKY